MVFDFYYNGDKLYSIQTNSFYYSARVLDFFDGDLTFEDGFLLCVDQAGFALDIGDESTFVVKSLDSDEYEYVSPLDVKLVAAMFANRFGRELTIW